MIFGNPTDMESWVPVKLPHFLRRGDELFFLISSRPYCQLSKAEAEVFDAIDGIRPLMEFGSPGTPARNAIVTLGDSGVVKLVPPQPIQTSPHLVVLEPHMDDAILSVGGQLAKRAGKQQITLVSSVRRSNYTSYWNLERDYFDVEEITALRIAESELVARMLGGRVKVMDTDDAPIRCVPPPRWSRPMFTRIHSEVDSYIASQPEFSDVERMAMRLRTLLAELQPDELWFPIGLGHHVDHRTLRAACFLLLYRDPQLFQSIAVFAYEDLPYSQPAHAEGIRNALTKAGVEFEPQIEDITDVFEEKIQLLSVYASQFKVAAMAPRLSAQVDGSIAKATEVMYRIGKVESAPTEIELGPQQYRDLEQANRVWQFLGTHRTPKDMAIFVLPSGHVGRWSYVLQTLKKNFPHTTICIYMDEDTFQLVGESMDTEGITVRTVSKHMFAWFSVLGREWLNFGTLSIISWWGIPSPRSHLVSLFKLLLPLRERFWIQDLTQFGNAIEAVAHGVVWQGRDG